MEPLLEVEAEVEHTNKVVKLQFQAVVRSSSSKYEAAKPMETSVCQSKYGLEK